MAKRLRYHPLFDCDIREAAGWYDRRSPGLGDEFIRLTRERVQDIIDHSDRYSARTEHFRYVRVSKFPYVVVFDANEDEIVLLAILHTARSSEKWKERRADD